MLVEVSISGPNICYPSPSPLNLFLIVLLYVAAGYSPQGSRFAEVYIDKVVALVSIG